MKKIEIKEHINHQDFLEASFPDVVKPIYKKRLFIINMAFGILFIFATIFLFVQTYKSGLGIETMHYFYLVFALLFPFLAFYLHKREKKFYNKLVDSLNDLETVYTFTDDTVKVKNKQAKLVYKLNEIDNVKELPKWLIFEFKNNERIAIYKPNINREDLHVLLEKFKPRIVA